MTDPIRNDQPAILRALQSRLNTLGAWHHATEEAMVRSQISMDTHGQLMNEAKDLVAAIDRVIARFAQHDAISALRHKENPKAKRTRGGASGRRAKAAADKRQAQKPPAKRLDVKNGKVQPSKKTTAPETAPQAPVDTTASPHEARNGKAPVSKANGKAAPDTAGSPETISSMQADV